MARYHSEAGTVMDLLRDADLDIIGQFSTASNATLLVRLVDPQAPASPVIEAAADVADILAIIPAAQLAVYKPRDGEAPLRDFPPGTLHRREVAAWLVSDAIGWDLVPNTVVRDGPFGIGSVQQFVEHNPEHHYFTLMDQGTPGVHAQLRRLVLFDLLINNADRKAGHVLLTEATAYAGTLDGTMIAVDHGVTFHVDAKLRTVAWDWAGSPFEELRRDLVRLREVFADRLEDPLAELLTKVERQALLRRIDAAIVMQHLPEPSGDRPYPWPPI